MNPLYMQCAPVQVADFGLSKSKVTEMSTLRSRKTVGSPAWSSPERLRVRADIRTGMFKPVYGHDQRVWPMLQCACVRL